MSNRSVSIGSKLYIAFGIGLVLTVAMGLFALKSIYTLGELVERVVTKDGVKESLASGVGTTLARILGDERGILERAGTHDQSGTDAFDRDFRRHLGELNSQSTALSAMLYTDAGRQMFGAFRSSADRLAPAHEQFIQQIRSSDPRAGDTLQGTLEPALRDATTAAERLLQQQGALMQEARASATSLVDSNLWVAVVMIGLSILVALITVFVVRGISRGLSRAIDELYAGADQVASAASQVSSSSQSLAQGSSEQAASLEETSASSQEINSVARRNSENSASVATLVTQSSQRFEQANDSLDHMVTAMGEISASSGKISKIIKVIDEIAFQTNILALNAAVEAARAGEAGLGFAVVADEVRNLAQRCAQAAKDTAELIDDSINKSSDGKVRVDEVAGAIREISAESKRVKTLIDEVNLGSQEQAQGIDQIGRAISQMEQVTQRTASSAEESAAASEELKAQSAALKDVIARLTAMVGGNNAGPVRNAEAGPSRASSPVSPVRKPAAASGQSAAARAKAYVPARKPAGQSATTLAERDHNPFPLDEEFREF